MTWAFLYGLVGAIVFGVVFALSDTDDVPSWKVMRALGLALTLWPFVLVGAVAASATEWLRWPR